jgi:hypothetical protein
MVAHARVQHVVMSLLLSCTLAALPGAAQAGVPNVATVVGAGDISTCTDNHDGETAALVSAVLQADPGATAFTVGDTVYPDGSPEYYTNCYGPTWGAFVSRTYPVIGNKEYVNSPRAAGYFAYFGDRAGRAGRGWYAYDAGTWRVYALNSDCRQISACAKQYNWLKGDLAAHPRQCVMAMWHRPHFNTGSHKTSPAMDAAFRLLYGKGAEIVVSGHDHNYQRFKPAKPNGVADAVRGIRQFIVGTGGAGLHPFSTTSALLEVRNYTSYGVLKLTLRPGSYAWEFIPVTTGAFTDSGQESCH